MATFPTQAAQRLPLYNSDFYDPNTNLYGMADGGHIVNFPMSLQDTASVLAYIAATSQEVKDDAAAVVTNLGATVAARDLAQKWAANPEDVVVSSGLFSGRHYAAKAAASASTAQQAAVAAQNATALKADLASPAFTGNPTVPNQAAGNSTTRIANTAFVTTAVANALTAIRDGVASSFDTLKKLYDWTAARLDEKLNLTGGTITGGLTVNGGISATASGIGEVRLTNGTSTRTGFVDFRDATGARAGYVGYATPTLISMQSEGGRYYSFDVRPRHGTAELATKEEVAAGDALQISRSGDTNLTANFTTTGTFSGTLDHRSGYFNINSFGSQHGSGYARIWYSATLRNLTFTGMGDGSGPVSLLGCSMAASQITGLGSLATKSSIATADIGNDQVTAPKIARNAVTFNELTTIATQTLLGRVASGTGDAAALTAAQAATLLGFAQTLTGDGTQRLPNGLILKWGKTSSTAAAYRYNFPVAFPNNCFLVVGSFSAITMPDNVLYGMSIDDWVAASFAIRKRSVAGNNGPIATTDAFQINYIAIGN